MVSCSYIANPLQRPTTLSFWPLPLQSAMAVSAPPLQLTRHITSSAQSHPAQSSLPEPLPGCSLLYNKSLSILPNTPSSRFAEIHIDPVPSRSTQETGFLSPIVLSSQGLQLCLHLPFSSLSLYSRLGQANI